MNCSARGRSKIGSWKVAGKSGLRTVIPEVSRYRKEFSMSIYEFDDKRSEESLVGLWKESYLCSMRFVVGCWAVGMLT
jgi:hypothetical protein